MSPTHPLVVGVSLKMYFDHDQTVRWCRGVRSMLRRRMVSADAVELVILPAFVSLPAVAEIFANMGVGLGAQDLFWEDRGPFTGEVGGPSLYQIGCRYVEIGHAERRRIFHEDSRTFAAKTVAASRNRLTPIICVGEPTSAPADEAAAVCIEELEQIFLGLTERDRPARLIIAYEPEWAIGADHPAPAEHIVAVCDALRTWLTSRSGFTTSQVIYGGTAGSGLLTRLRGRVDGLFLGRAAHDLNTLDAIIGEAVDVVV